CGRASHGLSPTWTPWWPLRRRSVAAPAAASAIVDASPAGVRNDVDSVDVWYSRRYGAVFLRRQRCLATLPNTAAAFAPAPDLLWPSNTAPSCAPGRVEASAPSRTLLPAPRPLNTWPSVCQTPDNLAYERISSGLRDPAAVGDKAKWFSCDLSRVCHDCCQPSQLFLGAEFRPVWPEAESSQELVTMATGANLPSSNNSVAPAALAPAEFAAAFRPQKFPTKPATDEFGDEIDAAGDDEQEDGRSGGAAARRSSSELSEDAEDDELDEGLGDCHSHLSHSMSTLTARSLRSATGGGPPPSSAASVADSVLSRPSLRCSDVRSAGPAASATPAPPNLSNLRSQTRYSHDDSSLGVGGGGGGGRRRRRQRRGFFSRHRR
uniref:AGC-kinase C-terminal domain-containing protein n=1 Tax=Macrostomum lignano TaxID=282301 RepID=A0A1I8IXV2_9PLAT